MGGSIRSCTNVVLLPQWIVNVEFLNKPQTTSQQHAPHIGHHIKKEILILQILVLLTILVLQNLKVITVSILSNQHPALVKGYILSHCCTPDQNIWGAK